MRKHFKGFTLIECLVALGILGIASLTMAQIYASVATRNKMNHLVNTSLSNQMAYVEKYTGSQAVAINYGNSTASDPAADSHQTPIVKAPANTAYRNYVTISKCKPNASDPSKLDVVAGEVYSFPVDIYVLESRDRDNKKLSESTRDAGYTESDYNLRYKYLIGHNNK